jgi:3-hydroxymyristoyl/3-hydroxydecanoyl-(acyl carrier protein) dehydratase
MDKSFLQNYSINKISPEEAIIKFNLSPEIVFFKGHFPSGPVLPAIAYIEIGVLLLKDLSISADSYSLKKSKFTQSLKPHDLVEVQLNIEGLSIKFNWMLEGKTIAEIRMTLN